MFLLLQSYSILFRKAISRQQNLRQLGAITIISGCRSLPSIDYAAYSFSPYCLVRGDISAHFGEVSVGGGFVACPRFLCHFPHNLCQHLVGRLIIGAETVFVQFLFRHRYAVLFVLANILFLCKSRKYNSLFLAKFNANDGLPVTR